MQNIEELEQVKKSGKILVITSSFFGICVLYIIYITGLLQGKAYGIASGIEFSLFLTGTSILYGSNHGIKKAKRSLLWAIFFTLIFLMGNVMVIISQMQFSMSIISLACLIYLIYKQSQTYNAIKKIDTKEWGEKRSILKSFPSYAYAVLLLYITLYAGGIYLLIQRISNEAI